MVVVVVVVIESNDGGRRAAGYWNDRLLYGRSQSDDQLQYNLSWNRREEDMK